MAGIFYFMTGIVNTFALYQRVQKGKLQPGKIFILGFAGGAWIFILNYIQRLFFMNGFVFGEDGGVPKYPAGLLIGFIQDAENVTFRWQQVTEPGTLSLIGSIVIIVSIVLSIVLREKFRNRIDLVQIVLLILAVVSIGFSPFSKFYLRPYFDHLMADGNYFQALLTGLVGEEFGLSPYLGYGFVGAAVGISLASGEDRKLFHRKGLYSAIALIVSGLIMILIFDKTDDFGRGAIGTGICLVELGFFIFLIKLLLRLFDYINAEKQRIRQVKTKTIRRFGMLALTVYIFEPLLAELSKKGIDLLLGPEWNGHILYVTFFGILCLLLWHLILRQWEKYKFAGSLEWLTGIILFKLIKKKTGKTNFEELS